MKIESVALSLPSWEVTNQEIIDLVRFNSKFDFCGNLDKTLRKIDVILRKTGSETRFWLNKQKNENPVDHIVKVVEDALIQSNLKKDDIDLLIYVGIGRGFIEPGGSHFVAKTLGMNKVRCFDVIDACMSWISALQIADNFFKSGVYKRVMLVNAEFTINSILSSNFSLKNEEQLNYTFPSFTIGECATCTILSPNEPSNFKFEFSSRNDLADLCTIPFSRFDSYIKNSEMSGLNGAFGFTSFGSMLHSLGEEEIVKLFKTLPINRNEIDVVFTHASSKNEWQRYGEIVGIGDKIYHISHKTGNLISASIPAAMVLAKKDKKLENGSKVLLWVGSAGMSFNGTIFTF